VTREWTPGSIVFPGNRVLRILSPRSAFTRKLTGVVSSKWGVLDEKFYANFARILILTGINTWQEKAELVGMNPLAAGRKAS